ncbi:hypothetical protein BH10BAC2_BH10BAC2_11410 [soil metagenome]
MKKTILFVVLLLSITLTLQAQVRSYKGYEQYKNEFAVGYGLYTAPQYLGSLADNFLAPLFTLGLSSRRSATSGYGTFVASWTHYNDRRFSYGVDFVTDQYSSVIYNANTNQKYSNNTYNFNSIMPHADFNFINNEHFRLYTNLAMGVVFASTKQRTDSSFSKDNKIGFAGNYTPLGFAYRTGHFSFLFETAFGFKPALATGIGYRF